jgi:hypothetical protein
MKKEKSDRLILDKLQSLKAANDCTATSIKEWSRDTEEIVLELIRQGMPLNLDALSVAATAILKERVARIAAETRVKIFNQLWPQMCHDCGLYEKKCECKA